MKGNTRLIIDFLIFLYVSLFILMVAVYHYYLDIPDVQCLSGDNNENLSTIPHIFGENIICRYDPIEQYKTTEEVYHHLPEKSGDFPMFVFNFTNYPNYLYIDPIDCSNPFCLKYNFVNSSIALMSHNEAHINSLELPLHSHNNPIYVYNLNILNSLDQENAKLFLESQNFDYIKVSKRQFAEMYREYHDKFKPNDFAHKSENINTLYERNRRAYKFYDTQCLSLRRHVRRVLTSLEVIFCHPIIDKEKLIEEICREIHIRGYVGKNNKEIRELIFSRLDFNYYNKLTICSPLLEWIESHANVDIFQVKSTYTHLQLKHIIEIEKAQRAFGGLLRGPSLHECLGLSRELGDSFFKILENAILCKNSMHNTDSILNIIARNIMLTELYNLKLTIMHDLHDKHLYNCLDTEQIRNKISQVYKIRVEATVTLQESIYHIKKDIIEVINAGKDVVSPYDYYKKINMLTLKLQIIDHLLETKNRVCFACGHMELFDVLEALKKDIITYIQNYNSYEKHGGIEPKLNSTLWKTTGESGDIQIKVPKLEYMDDNNTSTSNAN